ncbi:MAG: hypothetical protein GY854_30075, partial [Deltaproteobacteria bacterium]|nr:hypothetical protein [Deltaproteobacteria bacterium]
AADVYGAGAVAYELLTGKLPLGRFPQPSETRADVLPELNRLVPELLDLDPAKRPSARRARNRALARTVEPPAAVSKGRWAWVAAAAVLAIAVLFVVFGDLDDWRSLEPGGDEVAESVSQPAEAVEGGAEPGASNDQEPVDDGPPDQEAESLGAPAEQDAPRSEEVVEKPLKAIPRRMGYPRLMIVFHSTADWSDDALASSSRAAFNRIEDYLTSNHFEVVDREASEGLEAQIREVTNVDEIDDIASKYALEHQSEYVIYYQIAGRMRTQSVAESTAQVRIIDNSTGRVLANKEVTAVATHPTSIPAAYENAAGEAGLLAVREAMPVVLENWNLKLKDGALFTVIIFNISEANVERLYRFCDLLNTNVAENNRFRSFHERTFADGRMVLDVHFDGRNTDLTRILLQIAQESGMPLERELGKGNQITFRSR